MLDKQLQGQNPLLSLLSGTGSATPPVTKAEEVTDRETLDFKEVLDQESQPDRVENATELNPLEDVVADSESTRHVTAQLADNAQVVLPNGASPFVDAVAEATLLVDTQEPLPAQALPATGHLPTEPKEFSEATFEDATKLTPVGESATGALDPTSSGTTILNSESVLRLNLLREQNGAPQLSVGEQAIATVPSAEPTFPVLFPAQDASTENLGVIPTEETPTAKSVLGTQSNVAAEQALNASLVPTADSPNAESIKSIAASAAEGLPEQTVLEAATPNDRMNGQALPYETAPTEVAATSQNSAGEIGSPVNTSRDAQGLQVASANTLPTTKSPGQVQSNEQPTAEQLASVGQEETLESDAETEGNQLDGEANPESMPELETRSRIEPKNSAEPFTPQFQAAQDQFPNDSLQGSNEIKSVPPVPDSTPPGLGSGHAQSSPALEKPTSTQTMQFQTSVAEAQGHGVVDQISQPLREHVSLQRDGTLQVNLEPAELGRVSITVQRTADGLAAQLVAAESLTTELLITQQQDLKDTLVSFGFDEVHVDVSQRDDNDRTGERTDSRRQHSGGNQLDEQQDVVEDVNTSSGTINVVA